MGHQVRAAGLIGRVRDVSKYLLLVVLWSLAKWGNGHKSIVLSGVLD
jgi:hypothetical protein